jgi:hypothetical protein
MESEAALTQVGEPPASLLALARGEPAVEASSRTQPRRALWFCLGLLVGATGVWCAKSDVRADVYRARAWAANGLRAMRAHAGSSAPAEVSRLEKVVAIPTVNVTDLPREPDETAPKTSGPPAQPRVPGAPALPHAPGPR